MPNAQPTIIKQKAATAWVDGSNGLGAVVGHYCTELAIQLAKEHGVGWVVCKGSNHYGIAGYWPLLMKERGFLVDFYVASLNVKTLLFRAYLVQTPHLWFFRQERLSMLWAQIHLLSLLPH